MNRWEKEAADKAGAAVAAVEAAVAPVVAEAQVVETTAETTVMENVAAAIHKIEGEIVDLAHKVGV